MLTTGELNPAGQRWLAALAMYDFEIKYFPGKANVDADLLCHNWTDKDTEPWKKVSQGDVKAICCPVDAHLQESHNSDVHVADRLGAPAEGIPELHAFATHLTLGQVKLFT